MHKNDQKLIAAYQRRALLAHGRSKIALARLEQSESWIWFLEASMVASFVSIIGAIALVLLGVI